MGISGQTLPALIFILTSGRDCVGRWENKNESSGHTESSEAIRVRLQVSLPSYSVHSVHQDLAIVTDWLWTRMLVTTNLPEDSVFCEIMPVARDPVW